MRGHCDPHSLACPANSHFDVKAGQIVCIDVNFVGDTRVQTLATEVRLRTQGDNKEKRCDRASDRFHVVNLVSLLRISDAAGVTYLPFVCLALGSSANLVS